MGLLRVNDLHNASRLSEQIYIYFFALRIFTSRRCILRGSFVFTPCKKLVVDGRNDQTDTSFIIYVCTLISPVSDILLEYMYQQERAFPQKKQNIHFFFSKLRAAFLRQITPLPS